MTRLPRRTLCTTGLAGTAALLGGMYAFSQLSGKATPEEQKEFLSGRRNVNFLFNRVTDEKLAVDQGLYNSLMVQLLVGDPQDPRFSPYFKLVYDNVFARIYEVL